jgi:hypothetical protein
VKPQSFILRRGRRFGSDRNAEVFEILSLTLLTPPYTTILQYKKEAIPSERTPDRRKQRKPCKTLKFENLKFFFVFPSSSQRSVKQKMKRNFLKIITTNHL